MRAFVIAGTHSGCGKTTVSLAIMAALRKRGLSVQPFKAGPDFIDAGLHRLAAGRQSRNLDIWMCGQEYVRECFMRHAADVDIAVIEGVMGMYDGEYSTACLAGLLGVPVILVIDAYGMAESAGAVAYGFAEFGVRSSETGVRSQESGVRSHESGVRSQECGPAGGEAGNAMKPDAVPDIAGIIFNRVASEGHYIKLKESIKNLPVLGYLPREVELEIPHRHLGLVTAEEDSISKENINRLADIALKYIDIEQIIHSAALSSHEIDKSSGPPFRKWGQGGTWQRWVEDSFSKNKKSGSGHAVRIAVAYDKAFCFYYQDNIDLLRAGGAEIVFFSPFADDAIPSVADAVYIGGGYPELYAEALSKNTSMLGSVKAWAEEGRPMYAECGGLMYLSRGICDFDGRLYGMAGVLPFETRMSRRPRLGYREIEIKEDCIIGRRGDRFRGHEFHYSEIIRDGGQDSKDISHEYTRNGTKENVTQMMTEGKDEIEGYGSRVMGHGTWVEGIERIYSVKGKAGGLMQDEGFRYKNTLASYIHIHFGSNPGALNVFGFLSERVMR